MKLQDAGNVFEKQLPKNIMRCHTLTFAMHKLKKRNENSGFVEISIETCMDGHGGYGDDFFRSPPYKVYADFSDKKLKNIAFKQSFDSFELPNNHERLPVWHENRMTIDNIETVDETILVVEAFEQFLSTLGYELR